MKKLSISLLLSCIVIFAFVASSLAAFQADIDQNNDITIEDVILGLQVAAGESPTIPEFVEDLDVDGDNQIGVAEVLDALQSISTSGSSLRHQAVIVGPLSGSGITTYRADDLFDKIEGTRQASRSTSDLTVAGTFELSLTGIADDEWIVVSAEFGEDIDHDGNGIADTAIVENLGTLHAIARASDWRTRNIIISPLTEIVYQYTQNLISAVSADELEIRLKDLAYYLIKTDIDGNGAIDWHDFLAFNPADQTHLDSLKTSYDWLTTEDEEGNTILASILAGDEEQMLACMDETYSYLMTRSAVPDSRYDSIKITLSAFGQGSASADEPANLAVDSTAAEPVYEDHVYLPQNDTDPVNFTAIAGTDSQILSWTGCDTISADLSQCSVAMTKSHNVVVNFGRTTTQLKGVLHDLTNTTNYVYTDSITVFIPSDMTDMIDEMETAAVDDFVVGDDNGGFLRRITGITQNSATEYVLATVEASLEEVIAEGSGYLFKEMTNGDLEGYTVPAGIGQSATISPNAFTGPAGVQFIPATQPENKTFRLVLGNPDLNAVDPQDTLSAEVELYNDGEGGTLSATGEVLFEVDLDTGFDFGWTGLKAYKFVVNVDAEQGLDLTASAELAKFPRKRKWIGTLTFSPITFMIGILPVWITPTVDIYLYAEGKVEIAASFGITLMEEVGAGVLYNKETGGSSYKNSSIDWDYTLPEPSVEASIVGGVEVRSSMKIYDVTGPAIPIDGFVKLASSIDIVPGIDPEGHLCSDGIVMKMSTGATVSFMWEMSGQSKIGKMLHLDELEDNTKFSIVTLEEPLFEWNIFNTCAQPAYLAVDGEGVVKTIDYGDSNGQSTVLTISNDGDEVLNWNTSGIPAEVTVSPSQGELDPGESEVVQMSVATADLSVGKYSKEVFFYNENSVGSDLPDEEFGNTYKTIDISVLGSIIDSPSITSATSTSVGNVDLAWDFTQVGAEPLVGSQVYATTTPADDSSYSLMHTTNIYDRQESISGFSPGETYSIKVRVYSNSVTGPFSTPISVDVAGARSSTVAGTVVSNGRVWMDRNLGASRVAANLTDTDAYGDLYQWGRGTDGHEKRDSGATTTNATSDIPGHDLFIIEASSPYDWKTPQNNNLWQGGTGTNNPCPAGFRLPTETELETERTSWATNDAVGAYGSPLKLVAAGYRRYSDGTFRYAGSIGDYWSSTVDGVNSRRLYFSDDAYMHSYYRAYGFSVRCIQDYEPDPEVSTVTSIGQVWMDRNFGASRVAQTFNDTEAYGDLYQWGRGTDGHEKRTSAISSQTSDNDNPDLDSYPDNDGKFITAGSSSTNYDWRYPQNNELWLGVSGTNNPCPAGFRLPTDTEWDAERVAWVNEYGNTNDSDGAFASQLKLVVAGYRHHINGTVLYVGSGGNYWSSTVSGAGSRHLEFNGIGAGMDSYHRAYGFSIRCLKD